MSLLPEQADVWPCYRCGYSLLGNPRSTQCSECGSDDHVLRRREARTYVRRPRRLALRAFAFWRPMPPALWANRADQRFVSRLRKGRFGRLIAGALFAVFLLVFVGPLRYLEYAIVEPKPGTWPARWTTEPYKEVADFDVWGETSRSPAEPWTVQASRISAEDLPNWPYADRQGGFQWMWQWRQAALITTWTGTFVVLPVVVWIATIVFLRIWTAIGLRRLEVCKARSGVKATLVGVGRAAWQPIWFAWLGAVVMVIPLLCAPTATAPFRLACWWIFMSVATVGPVIVGARALAADRAGLFVRARLLASLLGLPICVATAGYVGLLTFFELIVAAYFESFDNFVWW